MLLDPITRVEHYLYEIITGASPARDPITREEHYLSAILGVGDAPSPITRIEYYLAKIAGEDVDTPTPVTRIEYFLAKKAGLEVEVPTPITRLEHYLAEWIEAAPSGYDVTVTGMLPLTLAHSLAANLIALVRTGSMTQTPASTPSAPVYPSINGGTVQMVDDELPAGYKRLLGITFDGNFHYETGEALTGDDVVTMTLDNLSTSGKNVFGSYNGANGKNFSLYIYGSSTSGSYFRFGDVLKRPVYGGTGRRTITFGAGGTSGFAEDVSINPDEFTTPANTYIGMLPNSSSPAYTGDIIGSIPVGTRLEWIPCESDGGVIGYYERVKGNFIAPTGSGTPVSLGYDNSHLVPRVVGDTEELSVSGINLFYNSEEWERGFFLTNGKVAAATANRTFVMRCAPNTTYYWKHCSLVGGVRAFTVDGDVVEVGVPGAWIKQNPVVGEINEVYSATTGANAKWLCVCFGRNESSSAPINEQWSDFMLSTAPLTADTPYAPYTAPQTASVVDLYAVGDYADEVDVVSGTVTRRVGMKVLTGNEEWTAKDQYNRVSVVVDDMSNPTSPRLMPAICTHYENLHNGEAISTVTAGQFYTAAPKRLYFHISEASTSDFKAYLAAQYAAGTPVIVWYPLATPTTESVTPQSLRTQDGTTVVSSSAGSVEATVEYRASQQPVGLFAAPPTPQEEPADEGTETANEEEPAEEVPVDGNEETEDNVKGDE